MSEAATVNAMDVSSRNAQEVPYHEAHEVTEEEFLYSLFENENRIQMSNLPTTNDAKNVYNHYLASCIQKNTKVLQKLLAVLDKPVVEPPPLPVEIKIAKRSNVTTVEIMTVFIKIENINTLKQQFEAEIIIRAKWEEPQLIEFNFTPEEWNSFDFKKLWNPKLKVVNIIDQPRVEKDWYQPSFHNYGHKHPLVVHYKKVKAVFSEPLELECFPIDTQELNVQISCDLPKEEVMLVEDANDLSMVETKQFMDKQDFTIYKVVESSIHEREYSEFEEPNLLIPLNKIDSQEVKLRPQINFTCYVARRSNFYVWNILVVMFIIISLCFMTFSISGQNGLRIGYNFTLLLTVVAFKFIVNNHIPRVTYFTYLEIYILCQLFFLVCVIVENALVAWIWNYRTEALARLVDYILLGILLGYYILYHLGYLIFFQRKKCLLMRQLEVKENLYQLRKLENEQIICHEDKQNVKAEYRNTRTRIFPLK